MGERVSSNAPAIGTETFAVPQPGGGVEHRHFVFNRTIANSEPGAELDLDATYRRQHFLSERAVGGSALAIRSALTLVRRDAIGALQRALRRSGAFSQAAFKGARASE